MYTKEIARKARKSDGKIFRIYDELPELGHYYIIEYLEQVDEHFHAWYPLYLDKKGLCDTCTRIATLEQAYAMLDKLTED